MRNFSFFLLSFVLISGAFSQSDTIKLKTKRGGTFYAATGYTRVWFSKSDIHFKDRSNHYHPATGNYNNYDFTLYGVKANDRPDYDKIPDIVNFTVPQYAWRLGYYFNNKSDIGIEINYDHTKYIANDYQRVHIKGDFNGNYVDKDTTMDPKNFIHFEHSDGANFLLINFVKRWKLINKSPLFNIGWVAKGGAGMVIPRTDVTIFGERLNNDFHIAGWLVGLETGVRTEFLKYGYFEFVGKTCFADYINALVLGKGNGVAKHHFYSYQLTAVLGVQIPPRKKK